MAVQALTGTISATSNGSGSLRTSYRLNGSVSSLATVNGQVGKSFGITGRIISGSSVTVTELRYVMGEERKETGFFGLDISSYQTISNADLLFSNVDFIYFRAYGSNHSGDGDTSFEDFVSLAAQHGVPSGAYYFGTPSNVADIQADAEAQADQFLLKLYNAYGYGRVGDLIPMLDIESYTDVTTGTANYPMATGMTGQQLVDWIKAFRDYFYNETGRALGLYVNRYFLQDPTQMAMTDEEVSQLSFMPLWIAEYDRYYKSNPTGSPEVLGGWKDYNLWQYEIIKDASSYGVTSSNNEIDHNYTYSMSQITPIEAPTNVELTQLTNRTIQITYTEPVDVDYTGSEIYVNGEFFGTVPKGSNETTIEVNTAIDDQLQVNVVAVDIWGDKGWSSNSYITMRDVEGLIPPPTTVPVKPHPLYIFNREEELVAVLEQGDKDACTYYNGKIKHVLNGEQLLTFTVPVTHPDAEKIEELGSVAVKNKYRQWQLYTITEIVEIHDEDGLIEKDVTAEGAFVELDDVIIEYLFHDRKRPAVVLPTLLSGTRWEVGSVEGTEIHDLTVERESILSALQTFRERWHGELTFRVEIVGNRIARRIIDFTPMQGAWKGKRFEYSEDLTEITRTIDARGLKTALYVYGPEIPDSNGLLMGIEDIEWVKANGDPTDKPLGQSWVGDDTSRLIWGRPIDGGTEKNHLFGVYENNDAVDNEDLIWKAWVNLQTINEPNISYDAKVVDLYNLLGIEAESVDLGDTVAVLDRDLGIEVQARIVQYVFDLDYPEKDDLTLGNYLPNFTTDSAQVDDLTRKVDNLEQTALKEGDTINPSWLDTEFEFAQDAIRLGGGTVIMNKNDGILIVDDPDNPQKAIKLNAGQIALADSRDIATNTFNWRAFGTGAGWLSDLVKTGFIQFDRSQGGTLLLGGEENGNGQLVVYDANGNVVGDLDSSKGGFTNLYVGNFRSDNVLNSNSDDMTIIVNPSTGDDNNDGLTSATALKRLQRAIDRIPKHNNAIVDIYVQKASFNEYEVRIEGFFGLGRIRIYFQQATLNGMIYIYSNNQRIELYDGFVNQIYGTQYLGDGTISVTRTLDVYLSNMNVYSRRNVDYGLRVRSGYCRVEDCKFYDNTTAGVYAELGGVIDMTGSNEGSGGYAGIRASGSGRIAVLDGTVPAGTVVKESVAGGDIVGAVPTSGTVGTPLILDAPPITTIFSPDVVRSWNSRKGWNTNNNYLYQGEWSDKDSLGNTTYYGNYKGCIFFNNSAILTAISGRTVLSARLRLKRLTYGGYSGQYPVTLWALDSQKSVVGVTEPVFDYNISSNTYFGWGEEDWITIPIWIITSLTNGSYGGLGIYTVNGSSYMIMEEDVKLEITYK
ncbi:phage tail protein [Priestia aryabhattai]|uniref:phage tail spike protein n=1 Tax=Priestia aryabhattai TaxID=412384 RepID=UPI00204072E4|nr:phage tail spike protein [Priestia aryabhattai]MCM3774041.1 phage tail protein [Priestia aryabhattai]